MTALSVIIPAKDVAPYIGDTLASLVRNDRPDFEYIVIDDGSTDTTPDIVDDFRKRLPNLRMLRNPAPTGLSSVRNQGVADSSGRYVTYLDGDDWFAPGYLPTVVEAADRLGVDFAKTDHVQVNGRQRSVHLVPEGRVNRALDPREGILPATTASMVNYPFTSAGIYHRRLVEAGLMRFDPALHTCEDQPWAWRLHLRAESYARIPVLGLFYRRGLAGSLTQIGDSRQLHFLDAFRTVLDDVLADREAERFLPKAVRTFCAILLNQAEKGDRLSPQDRKEMFSRGRELLTSLPAQHIVDATIREMGGKRERRLRKILAGSSRPLAV
ncbi:MULTISPECIES: glycosyltransferase family 2 protein [unclassified Nocardiopsis]|uniref:glycosyltransferase family 2 protein n=1 Tax=Nocardiopsis TaxID=2013 RepID=UPI00387B563D